MKSTVNLAIQILPMSVESTEAYQAIDEAIKVVQDSGLKYVVSPFETVIEGEYETVMSVLNQMQEAVFAKNINHILVNMKLQRKQHENVYISDKLEKYN